MRGQMKIRAALARLLSTFASRDSTLTWRTGKHYNYFRDYDPAIGRYLASDPVGLAAGLSTYGYVDGDPLQYSDRHGMAISLSGAIFIAVGAYGAYNLWDNYSKQKKCEELCPVLCKNIRACGDTEKNYMFEMN